MLETDRAQIIQSIRGINDQLDQTDPQNVVNLRGAYPALIGLQERVPGKTRTGEYAYPVNGVAVFYNVYGRRYLLWEGLNLTIDGVSWDLSLSWRPPVVEDGYDPLSDYLDGAIGKLILGEWNYFNEGTFVSLFPALYDTLEFYTDGSISKLDSATAEEPINFADFLNGKIYPTDEFVWDDLSTYADATTYTELTDYDYYETQVTFTGDGTWTDVTP